MNYIHQLKRAIAVRDAQIRTMDCQIALFYEFLHGPKFIGEDSGEPKNWIATEDVIEWLRAVRAQSITAGDNQSAAWSPCSPLEPIAD